MKTIPIIDLGNIRDETSEVSNNPKWLEVAEKIRDGLGSIGFLYLVNHGLPSETISNAMEQNKKFFALPPEIKKKYQKNTSSKDKGVFDLKEYSGYAPTGGEKLDKNVKFELKETFDWVGSRYATCPTEEVPNFENSLKQLDMESKRLYKKILKLLALALKLDDADFFVNTCRFFDSPEEYIGLWNIRFLHYPSIEDAMEAVPGVVRCGQHSDYGFLTLLFQDDVGGLEVQSIDGEWVEAKPIPGSILLNTGDLTEFWTSGIFPATVHRIRIPNEDDEKRMQDRYSIAAFLGPDSCTTVTPMDLEKRPMEQKRLERNGKTYVKEPISAHDHFFGRIARQYL